MSSEDQPLPGASTTELGQAADQTESFNGLMPGSHSMQAGTKDQYVAYTIKLPAGQLAALQSIWLELKRLYGTHSPDKSGMIQQAVEIWLKKWDSQERSDLLSQLLDIREDTRRRQYRK